ncbi:MAG: CopG family transcriptional regulator [Nanoarchaeota archaeon]|nr:CopG family transcriptional regulator [Nanoarchaeota archaeon]
MAKDNVIVLPLELLDKIEKRIQDTEFSSVSDYVLYILKQVLTNIEQEMDHNKRDILDNSPESDERKVQERLKRLESLGYLD